MNKKMNAAVTFEFYDGTTTELSLTFYNLYQLKGKNRDLYDRYNKIVNRKDNTELDLITLLYAAYVCAHLDTEIMTEEEFMIGCGSDRQYVGEVVGQLMRPKKQMASENHFKDEQEENKEE